MNLTVSDIAKQYKGEVIGDPAQQITGLSKIDQAAEGTLSFLANPKYAEFLSSTKASAVLVNGVVTIHERPGLTYIRVDDPYTVFTQILTQYFTTAAQKSGIEKGANIAEGAEVAAEAYVGSGAYIGPGAVVAAGAKIFPNAYVGDNARVGKNTIMYAGAIVYHDCIIGDDCIIHSGAVIGSDGFGFAPQADGTYQKIPQTGNVIIGNRVEIGSNCSIDRATLGSTVLKDGVKLDNQIQIAHNVEIGENTVIAAQSGISGSTKIGRNCVIAGQVGFTGHLEIADGSKFGAKSGIQTNIKEPNKSWNGAPAMEYVQSMRVLVALRNLPDMVSRMNELEKLISELNDNK